MATTVKLQSHDNQIFEVDVKVAKMSITIKNMLEELSMDNDNDEAVTLPGIHGCTLKKVIEWMEYHKDDPPSVQVTEYSEPRTDDLSEWDLEFVNVEHLTLFALIRAANFLSIEGLMNITSKTMAKMISGKNVDQIKEYFNLEPKPKQNPVKTAL